MLEIFLVAVGLSMDAFAVSVSAAACSKNLRKTHMFRAAFAFGFFQFIMPLAGWFLGAAASGIVGKLDHWLAFALLAFVGGKMLFETYEEWKENPGASCDVGDECARRDLSSKRITLLLAVATSLDALAVGIGFAVIGKPAFVPSITIGCVTFVLCSLGFYFGKKAGLLLGRYAQIAGGVTLVGIGARILVTHLAVGI